MRYSKAIASTGGRRSFLKATGSALAAAPLLAHGAEINDNAGDYDVVIIGGGFAGATAARELSLRGHRTLLLEARPQMGGRVFTLPIDDHNIDLGGTWIGWSQPHVWSEVMRYGLTIDESASAKAERAIWLSNNQRTEGAVGDWGGIVQRATDAFYAPAKSAFPRPFDPLFSNSAHALDGVTAAEAIAELELGETERTLMMALASVNAHAPAEFSSYLDQLRWIALGDFNIWNLLSNLGRYRIRGGATHLLKQIIDDSGAEIRTDAPVSHISQEDHGVTVTTKAGGTVRGRTAIVAVPLNCLADISFDPLIDPAKLRVSRDRHTGSGVKLYAKVRGASGPLLASGSHSSPINLMWTEYQDKDSQILVAYGASPELLDVNSEDSVSDAIRSFLPECEVEDFFTYDWNIDPYSRGTWCMYRPNVLTQDLESLRKSEGNLFFAGSDIALGWRGTIDGAIESGLGVSRAVSEKIS